MANSSSSRSQADLTAELQARLRQSGNATAPAATPVAPAAPARPGNMHMNDAPRGPSRSLQDLVGAQPAAGEAGAESKIMQDMNVPVDLSEIDDSPYQPRTRYDETELLLLGEQLRMQGQDEPVRVRRLANGRYQLISGHRRVRAARLIGWATIVARILTLEDREAEIATLTSNESHVGLSDFERGCAYQLALDKGFATTQKDVARLFACSQGRVSQCLSVARLPPPLVAMLADYPSLLTYRHAKIVREVLDHDPESLPAVMAAVETIIDEPDLEPEQLRVRCTTKKVGMRPRAKVAIQKTVPDRSGESVFTVRSNNRNLVVNFNDRLSPEQKAEAEKQILAALKGVVESLEVPDNA
jgi:ParB family chromosome partitioning protein